MHLIDILTKKTKSSQILSIYFSFLFSYFLFISQCLFANFTLNLGKRQERGRVSNHTLFLNEKIYYSYFLSFVIIIFCARTFFSIILVLSFYMFFFSFFIFIFGDHVLPFLFFPIYFTLNFPIIDFFLLCFPVCLKISFFFFYICEGWLKKKIPLY
jgi:hypothetical protein